MSGKPVLFMLNGVEINQDDPNAQMYGPKLIPVTNRLNEILTNYGFTVAENMIFDDNAYRESIIDIIVENTNSYIEPELAEKVFTPFFTTKSHGVGIGLAISKRIVEAHGGSMVIKSVNSPSKITTFFVSIPVNLNN